MSRKHHYEYAVTAGALLLGCLPTESAVGRVQLLGLPSPSAPSSGSVTGQAAAAQVTLLGLLGTATSASLVSIGISTVNAESDFGQASGAMADYTDIIARFTDQVAAETLAKFIADAGISCDVVDRGDIAAPMPESFGVRVPRDRIEQRWHCVSLVTLERPRSCGKTCRRSTIWKLQAGELGRKWRGRFSHYRDPICPTPLHHRSRSAASGHNRTLDLRVS